MKDPESADDFLATMMNVQSNRREEVGGHTWEKYTKRYGPKILFAEIASITSRIESLIWDRYEPVELTEIERVRLSDLTVDLANYAGFLWKWAGDEDG